MQINLCLFSILLVQSYMTYVTTCEKLKIWIEDDNIYKQACTPITISGVLLMKNQRHVHDFLRIQYLCTSGVHCKMALEL